MNQEQRMAFEFPTEMRNFAEKSMEQARTAFDSFVSATQQAVNTVHDQTVTAQSGAREVGELALQFVERNMMSSFQFAQRLLNAKDAQEVTRLHTEYVNSQMGALADQAKELSLKASRIAGKALRRAGYGIASRSLALKVKDFCAMQYFYCIAPKMCYIE